MDSGAFSDTVAFDVPANSGLPGYVIVNFSDFSGVDFTSVDSIELGFDFASAAGAEVTIDNFFAANGVPEPSAIVIVIGVALFTSVRRRR